MGDGVELEILNEEEKKNEEPELEEDDDQLVPSQKIAPPEKLSYPAMAGVLGALLVILLLIVVGITIVVVVYLETSTVIMYKKTSNSIIEESRSQADFVYNRLTNFSDLFPARISSSQNLLSAIDWVKQQLINDGFKHVRTQEVSVPNWQRNTGESLTLLEPRIKNMRILSLGNSVNTPQEGIQGEVFVVNSFQELTDKADQAYGKIVLFNAAFTNYSETVRYRIGGAVAAAKVNAKAALVRSITPFSLQTPHTGVMYYEDGIPQIPTAAITIEDAEYLKRLQDQGVKIVVELKLYCETLEDTIAYNVIGEIPGSESPDEIVLVGGHIDSWDVGNGAMDDGGGLVASWQACKLIMDLGLTPRRTIRFIGWVDEENRSSGSVAYFDSLTTEEIANHILAIESDSGVFTPKSLTINAVEDSEQWNLINNIANRLMKEIGSLTVVTSDGAEDTEVLREHNIPVSELLVDESQYFWYHHTEADTIDKLNKDQIADCAATLSILTYVIADFEKSLTSLS